MRKLRNIGYLRFGSKIRQGFASGITSLTPPLSLSPLWISWAENEGAREGAEFYIWGGSLPPPCRAAGPVPPHHLAAGGLPPGRGVAGSRPKYKTPPLPSRPDFLPTRTREGRGREEG